jgi:hypothetical protein
MRPDEIRRDGGDIADAGQRHGFVKLGRQNVDCVSHALCACSRQAPEERTTDHAGAGSEREGFEYVGPTPNAAVEDDLRLASNRRDDTRQGCAGA